MSDESEPKKNIDTPVSKEELAELRALTDARLELADRLLTLRQEEIRILAAAKRIDDQHSERFQAILASRGVDPTAGVEVDASTGKVTLNKEEPEA